LNSTEPQTATRVQIGLAAVTLAALWFVLCRHLSSEWSINEQYSYGWFVPFFAAFLFWLRWEDAPERRMEPAGAERHGRSPKGERAGASESKAKGERRKWAIAIGMVALVILFPVRLFEVANPDWRPLGWLHAFAVIALTFVVIYHAGGWPWVKHFSFPILFFLVAVPWVSPIEQPIVQGLMRIIASLAAETVSLCGIPAQVQGNLIRIANGVVGVNEACSGVRSLQTSIMIGLLFGELKRLSVSRRVVLLAAAIAIALIANLFRAIFLVWIASTRELSAVERWHDLAGHAIVAVVFCGSVLLTAVLARRAGKVERRMEPAGAERHGQRPTGERAGASESKAKIENEKGVAAGASPLTSDFRPPTSAFIPHPSSFILSLLWLVAIEAGVENWYRSHERNLAARPAWKVRVPETAPGFREIRIEEAVRQTLRYDAGREVLWKTVDARTPENSATNYLFFFRWNPGSSSVVRARAHRPDICLPSVGWKQTADLGVKTYLAGDGIALPMRHITFRQEGGNAVIHTFFCLQEDKVRTDEARPDLELANGIQPDWSFVARARMVRLGERNLGQQVLEFVVITSQSVKPEDAEARFAALLPGLVEQSRK
jgi:exosortase